MKYNFDARIVQLLMHVKLYLILKIYFNLFTNLNSPSIHSQPLNTALVWQDTKYNLKSVTLVLVSWSDDSQETFVFW